VLVALNDRGSNTRQIDEIQIQAQSQCDVLLFDLTSQDIANAALQLENATIQAVERAAKGVADSTSQENELSPTSDALRMPSILR
jgi:hypothetical protein